MATSRFGLLVNLFGGRRRLRLPLVAEMAIAAVLFALVPASVGATTPGQNGRIAFRTYFNADHTAGALFTVNPDGTQVRQVTFPAEGVLDNSENWSPDGTKLAFQRFPPGGPDYGPAELYVVNADGSNTHRVAAIDGDVDSPAWTPDGRSIAFTLATGGVVNDMAADVSIWEIGADGTGLHQITHPIGFQKSEDHAVQFSPDGTRLVTERELASCGWCSEIYVVDAIDGGHPTQVSPRGLFGFDHPDWSPDGQWIMFRSQPGRGGSSKVYVAHPDGTHLQQILDGSATGRTFMSSTFSPDGRQMTIAIVPGAGPDGNADVWTGTFDSHERIISLTPITRTSAWESAARWGTASLIH
jgi:Tol biopolymer transport system component